MSDQPCINIVPVYTEWDRKFTKRAILHEENHKEMVDAMMMWPSRVKSVLKDRWLGLCLGMWMQACGGISYVFSLYSGDLKHTLGYNQEMIDGLGTAKDIGGNVGIISGLLIDLHLPGLCSLLVDLCIAASTFW